MDRDSKLIFEQYKQIINEGKGQFDSWKKGPTAPFSGRVEKHGAGAPEAHGTFSRTTTDERPESSQRAEDNRYDEIISGQKKFDALEGLDETQKQAIVKSQEDRYLENAFNPVGQVGQIPIFKSANALNTLLTHIKYILRNDSIPFRTAAIKYLKNVAKNIEENYDEIFLINLEDNNFTNLPYTKIAKASKDKNIEALRSIQNGKFSEIKSIDKNGKLLVLFDSSKGDGLLDEFSVRPRTINKFGRPTKISVGSNPSSETGREGSGFNPNEPGERNPLNPGKQAPPSAPSPFYRGKKSGINPRPRA
ncbi:MAG: hypothetical protein RL728_625 [Bacteroidota bacterium]|jgi:hypothetical protein